MPSSDHARGRVSVILNSANLKIPQTWWDVHLKINSDHCIELWTNLSLKLIAKDFKSCIMFSFCHVDPDLGYWYIIGKVNNTNRRLNLKLHCTLSFTGWEFYAKPAFFFYIFSGDLHFDAKVIRLCLICRVMGPLEKEHFKR